MVRKQRFELAEHMTKHQAQFGQISSIMRILVVHFFLAFFKQLNGLFAFSDHVQYEHIEMFVGIQFGQVVLVLRVYEP